ncbi:hypothetical protein [Vitiosangium sp. GDMCC 1.1324]|uniref:hypothetical protein n=1 Tax=Vitiosangium sp. (strain GDMCC 1.1324) TaxID=2138576 RepID=UPI000D3C49BE|nr:hypothetical protein [Vitiosangium sp. GDMCC 1.1324]PTL79619.1 hypothetical protein DAT35_32950 [Vitiosangium sp. GDMCC 1.1324]
MATNETRLLVEKLKEAALRVSTQGVRYIVEGTAAAVKVMDRLQELMPKQERVVRVKREPAPGRPATPVPPMVSRPDRQVLQQTRTTATRVLEEARATQKRIKEARPARSPLKGSAPEAQTEQPAAPKRQATARRTQGRKATPTASATAPKRATASKRAPEHPEGFKAKRGQKHKH